MNIYNREQGFVVYDVTMHELVQDAILVCPEDIEGRELTPIERLQQEHYRIIEVLTHIMGYVPKQDILHVLGQFERYQMLPDDYPRPPSDL